jgi:hypothetical protein
MDIDELDLDDINCNQSQTFDLYNHCHKPSSGNNSVWFPKAGLKISGEGMRTLANGSII